MTTHEWMPRIATLLLATQLSALSATGDGSFLKDGDRWLLLGDSITHTDTYRRLVLRVLQHYHPGADIMVGNSAVSGVASDYASVSEFVPTVVTIMLGMNDVIHSEWGFSPDWNGKVASYRTAIGRKVDQYQALGAEVILMTPTYSDERFTTFFNATQTRGFLEAVGPVVSALAAEKNCHWVPTGEELEAFQDTMGPGRHFRPDGVHPYGLGQYQIARTLIERLRLAGPLEGRRVIAGEVPPPVPCRVELVSRFMHNPGDGVTLRLSAEVPLEVTLRWSLDQERGSEPLAIGSAPVLWTIPASAATLGMAPGNWKQIVLELSAGAGHSLYILDLARTRVLDLRDGSLEEEIRTDEPRAEGSVVGTWRIEEHESELWISGTVHDNEIPWKPGWVFAHDGVHAWLDLRPAERFADINPDRDIHQLFLNVRETPFFSVTPVAWIGPRLAYALNAGGRRTETGYRWHAVLGGSFTTYRAFDIRKLDYFGLNLQISDQDTLPRDQQRYYPVMPVLGVSGQMQRLNLMMIVDRSDTFPGSETTNLHLFGR